SPRGRVAGSPPAPVHVIAQQRDHGPPTRAGRAASARVYEAGGAVRGLGCSGYGEQMRVLVLGGNRYIGLRLVFELASCGHDITIVNSHEAEMPPGARRIHADRQEPGALAEALSGHRDDFDAVFD